MRLAALLLCVPALASAQVTIERDGVPVATVTAAPVCGQAHQDPQPAPVVNPTELRFADPADLTRDCVIALAETVGGLPEGTGYQAGQDGQWTTAFAVSRALPDTHPCDRPAVSSLTVRRREPFTLGWCHPLIDEDGYPLAVTGWLVSRDGAPLVAPAEAGTSVSLSGTVLVTLAWLESSAGVYAYTLQAQSATGASLASDAVTVTVRSGRPVPPSRGRVTSP